MKKKIFSFLSVFLLLGLVLTLTSCKKYTIDFEENGGSDVTNVQFKEGDVLEAPTEPTKAGLVFGGWYTDEGLTKEFKFGVEMPKGDILLFAKWNAKLEFDTVGGDPLEPLIKEPLTYTELPEATKAGYVFAGWYKDAAYTTEQENLMPATNSKVYAKWLEKDAGTSIKLGKFTSNDANAYTVEEAADGTKFTATKDKGEWSFVSTPIDFDLYTENYVLAEVLVKGTKDSSILIKVEGGQQPDKDNKLTNVVAAEKTFKLTGEEQTIQWTIPTTALTQTGGSKFLVFVNPGVAGTGVEEGQDPVYVKIKDVKLYRAVEHEEAGKESAIFFNTNGGSAINPIYKLKGDEVEAPTDPTRDGYAFAGWYTDPELTEAYTFTTMPETSVMLYAKWDLTAYFSVDLLKDTYKELDPDTYTFELVEGVLKVKKIGTGGYQFATGTLKGSDIGGCTYLNITIKGVNGQKITFKVNDQIEKEIVCDGTVQTFSFDISGLSIDVNKVALILFINGGTESASEEFEIYQLEYANYTTPHNLLTDTYKELDPDTYTFELVEGVLKVKKIGTGGYQFAAGTLKGDIIKGYKYLNVTIKGVNGQKITFKVNNQGNPWEKEIVCDGTVQTFSFDISELSIDVNKEALVLFINGGTESASEEFEIYQLEYSCVANPYNLLTDTYKELDENTYTFELANDVLKVKKIGTGGWQFATGTLKGDIIKGYTSFNVTIKGVNGQKITLKVNDQTEKEIVCDGTVQTFSFDISELSIDVNKVALILFINGGTESASEEFEIYQLEFAN